MARIRSVKPEFWSSPSTANASPLARLAFIAMWNWADDHGRGTANLKELEGFIFPNDDVHELSSGNTAHFRDVVAEVSECFDVVFYEAENRPYYAILNWDKHQRNERRSKDSKYPDPPATPVKMARVAEIPSQGAVDPNISGPGTGEQGNRGTVTSSEIADAIPDEEREDVGNLCTLLANLIEENGSKRPVITKAWRDSARLMLDKDHRTFDQVEWMIRWTQADEFWRANILSMPKLRSKFDQLRLRAVPDKAKPAAGQTEWWLR